MNKIGIGLLALGFALMMIAMPIGTIAAEPLVHATYLRNDPLNGSLAPDDSIHSLLGCEPPQEDDQDGDGQNETTGSPENESGEKEEGDSSGEEECDPLEETKEDLKEDLDEIPRIAYCQRINGRVTCVGINDSHICALFIQYEYRFCFGLWKDL